MSSRFSCSGDYYAHQAGEEAPACGICDDFILDPSKTVRWTTRGKPVCKVCTDAMEEIAEENRRANVRALASILDPRETRASDLLRAPRPNFHD